MRTKKLFGMPGVFTWLLLLLMFAGILYGSFYDLQVSEVVTNVTPAGSILQDYASVVPVLFYMVAGACIFAGLNKKGERYCKLSTCILLVTGYWTLHVLNNGFGKYLRRDLGYTFGEQSYVFILICTYLIWAALVALVAFVTLVIVNTNYDKKKVNALIAAGVVIIISGEIGEAVNDWLKVLACRPRYRYLVTLEDPASEFRNWWQWTPYLKDESNFRSWPSGHMTKAIMPMLALPMIADAMKQRKNILKYILFFIGLIWSMLIAYNRIHMNAHFLTDVCFGVGLTLCIYIVVYKGVFSFVNKTEELK